MSLPPSALAQSGSPVLPSTLRTSTDPIRSTTPTSSTTSSPGASTSHLPSLLVRNSIAGPSRLTQPNLSQAYTAQGDTTSPTKGRRAGSGVGNKPFSSDASPSKQQHHPAPAPPALRHTLSSATLAPPSLSLGSHSNGGTPVLSQLSSNDGDSNPSISEETRLDNSDLRSGPFGYIAGNADSIQQVNGSENAIIDEEPDRQPPISPTSSVASSLSDASSEFISLVERAGGHLRQKSSSTTTKGKAKEINPAESVNATLSDIESVDHEVFDSPSLDPREMLRAQLKRSASAGMALPRTRSNLKALQSDVSVDALPVEEEGFGDYPPRRYFILSSAGKLIFTTDEDEEEATGYVGVMQAIISLFADEGDRIRYMDAGTMKIAFLLKAPLYLVCVSSWGEPESVLRTHLDYLYLQVLSVVTQSQLNAIFARRSNFDLRRMLEGTEPFFKSLTATLQTSLSILTSSLEVYRVEQTIREDVAKALAPGMGKIKDLLYAFVLCKGKVVTLLRPRRHSIHPSDLHLLLSSIYSSPSILEADSESWIPICLPRFNAKGFLHSYISFLPPEGNANDATTEIANGSTGIVLVGGDKEGFALMREAASKIKERLLSTTGSGKKNDNLIKMLEKRAKWQDYSIGELGIPGLRHFLYKSRTNVQLTYPCFEGDYERAADKYRLITLYQRVHEAIHPRSNVNLGSSRPASKLVYFRNEHEAVMGWTTSTYEVYLAVSPLLPKNLVVSAAKALTKWVKSEEGNLFLASAPSF